MKVRELIWFTGSFYQQWDTARVEQLVTRFGVSLDQKVKNLSRGMNAQVALGLALGHSPKVLLLDESAGGLDVIVRRDFLESIIQVIQEEGRTVLLSSHLVHEIERVADRIAIIDGGKLRAHGGLDEIKSSVKKVLVRAQQPVDFGHVDGISQVGSSGTQQELTVMDYDEGKLAAIKAAGGEVIEVIDLSLEDVFVEYVRDGQAVEVAA